MESAIKNLNLEQPGELIIREGAAQQIVNFAMVIVTGDIGAPVEWFLTKFDDIDVVKSFFTVDKQRRQIELALNADQENGRLAHRIKGEINLDNTFKDFKINTGFRWDLNDLANFLKFNRKRFASTDDAMKVVSGLKSFRASVSRDIEKTQDDRGNHRRLDDKRITSELPEVFTLRMAIFQYDIEMDFDVELCIEEKEGIVRAFLQSVSVAELIEERVDQLIAEQIDRIPDGVTTIYV